MKLGPDHPAVLNTMNSLAVALGKSGRVDEAVPLLDETLALEKAKLGPRHPDTLRTMSDVAAVLFEAGRRDEALVRGAEAMELMKSELGTDHPRTLECMANLAGNYLRVGRRDEARTLCEQLVDLRTNKQGPAHPDTLASERLLSFIYVELREYSLTQKVLERMLESQPLDALTWCHLGLVRLASGDQEGYQRGCHELIRRHVEAAAPPFPGWELAWCCKMGPLRDEDAQQVARVAREAYAAEADNCRARSELACALYRAGKIDESLQHTQALWDSEVTNRVWSGVWLALAHARLGHVDHG